MSKGQDVKGTGAGVVDLSLWQGTLICYKNIKGFRSLFAYYYNFVPLVQLKTINMPRQARKTSGAGIYHVMLRGINRQDIFEDDEDYMKFLQSLHQLVECYDERGYRMPSLCHFFAYCLMPNHVHDLFKT